MRGIIGVKVNIRQIQSDLSMKWGLFRSEVEGSQPHQLLPGGRSVAHINENPVWLGFYRDPLKPLRVPHSAVRMMNQTTQ
jgi:hypothetical protein